MDQGKTKEKLIALIEPVVEQQGFELAHLDYIPGKSGGLHLYIDREGGVLVEHCELVSRIVSDLLDEHDPIKHAYVLEVSSPGLERPLSKKEHFLRFRGEKVRIKTMEKIDGSVNFSGRLLEVKEGVVLVEKDDGREVTIPLDKITKAHLRYG